MPKKMLREKSRNLRIIFFYFPSPAVANGQSFHDTHSVAAGLGKKENEKGTSIPFLLFS